MRALLIAAIAASGCLASEFVCANDAQCVSRVAAGRCVPATRHCAFPDGACASGFVYAAWSGADSGRCVDVDGGATD